MLSRRLDQQAGGDANRRVIHEGLSAHVREVSEFVRNEGSGVAERVLITRMLFHPFDRKGVVLDIEAGDFVAYPDYRGITQERQITAVDPVTVLGSLDSLIVEAERP